MTAPARNHAIDMYKGLGILLVVAGHAWAVPEPVYKAIYSMHIPAFLLLAGLMSQPARAAVAPGSYVAGKFRRLVLPAWGMGLLLSLPYLAATGLGRVAPEEFALRLWGTLSGSAINEWNFVSTPLWYLFCLFWLEALAACLARWGAAVAGLVMTALGLAWMLVSQGEATWSDDPPLEWPFATRATGSAMAFFGCGMWLGARGHVAFRRPSLTASRVAALLLVLGLWALTMAASPDVLNLSRNRIAQGPLALALNLVAALAGAYVLWQLAVLVPASRLLCWLGQHTLPVFGFNYAVNKLVHAVLGMAGVRVAHLGAWWWCLAMVELLVLMALAWLLDRAGPLGDLFNGRPLGAGRQRLAVRGGQRAVE